MFERRKTLEMTKILLMKPSIIFLRVVRCLSAYAVTVQHNFPSIFARTHAVLNEDLPRGDENETSQGPMQLERVKI